MLYRCSLLGYGAHKPPGTCPGANYIFHINYIGIKVISLLWDNLAKGWIFGFNFIL